MGELNFRDDPVLAQLWDNEEDAVYDTIGTAGPENVAVMGVKRMGFWARLKLAWKVLWGL